jgi:hypothetical protein
MELILPALFVFRKKFSFICYFKALLKGTQAPAGYFRIYFSPFYATAFPFSKSGYTGRAESDIIMKKSCRQHQENSGIGQQKSFPVRKGGIWKFSL